MKVVALALLGLCVSACASKPSGKAPTAPVVLAIVVDQFAAWVASERFPELPADGGFARLQREGTYVRAIRYAHAATETACGHAALYTGAPPSRTGILSNEALHGGHVVSTMQDEDTHFVLAAGESPRSGASPKVLQARAVADELRDAHPKAVILGLSLKDRGAILPSGHKANVAVWLDIDTGELTTSTYYANKLPKWAATVSADIKRRVAQPWTVLDPTWLAKHVFTPDDAPGEEPEAKTFPHDFSKIFPAGAATRLHPASDGMLVDLALAGIDAEYKAGEPLLVTVSFSTNDLVGHAYGPDSWEQWDELLRLDGELARLFAAMDKRFGAQGWSALLSADHGVSPIPEAQKLRPECAPDAPPDRWKRSCDHQARVSRNELARAVTAEANKVLGEGHWVHGFVGAFVALTEEGRARRAELMPALLARIAAFPEVAHAIDVQSLPKECPEQPTTLEGLVCNAYPPSSSGDIMVVLASGTGFGDGSGASHGMPYEYDLTVPFLARAPGQVQPGVVIEETLPFASFTHTLAHLLRVKAPETAFAGTVLH